MQNAKYDLMQPTDEVTGDPIPGTKRLVILLQDEEGYWSVADILEWDTTEKEQVDYVDNYMNILKGMYRWEKPWE